MSSILDVSALILSSFVFKVDKLMSPYLLNEPKTSKPICSLALSFSVFIFASPALVSMELSPT